MKRPGRTGVGMMARAVAALILGVSVLAGAAARADAPDANGAIGIAGFRCQEFLTLLEENPEAAAAVVRWIDGWHAAGANDPRFTAADIEKQVEAATVACFRYPKRTLIKVMGGKFR